MSDATVDMSLQESCLDAARHLSVEVLLLASKADELEKENTKLRELVHQWYPHMLKRVGRDALEQWGQMDVVEELRIEVRE